MILITGGMGFIGLHTARSFLDAGDDVVLTRYRAWRMPDFLEPELGSRVHVENVDVTDGWGLLDVMRRYDVDSAVHLAGPALDAPPAQGFDAAQRGLVNVLEAARQQGVRRISVASSVSVYSNAGRGPWREDRLLPVASDSPVAATKKAMEVVALNFADRAKLDVVLLRMAGIYGPLYHSMSNLPSRLCHAAARGGQPDLRGVRGGPPALEDLSDFCYVKDCAWAILCVHVARGLQHHVYNVGDGRATSVEELAAAVQRAQPGAAFSFPSRADPDRDPAPHMDISRIEADTGYRPSYDVAAGVGDYIGWLRDHAQ